MECLCILYYFIYYDTINLSFCKFFDFYTAYGSQSWCIFQWRFHHPASSRELPNVSTSWNCSGWVVYSSHLWAAAGCCSVAAAAASAGKRCIECSSAAAKNISCESGRQQWWLWLWWRGGSALAWCSVWTRQTGTTAKSVIIILLYRLRALFTVNDVVGF